MTTFRDWLAEAKIDLQAASSLGQAGFYAQACFHCQQGVEKALKAFLIFKKNELPKSHSLRELASKAGRLEELRELISDLEGDYTATRYLDVAGKPLNALYTSKEFKKRFASAEKTIELIEKWMKT